MCDMIQATMPPLTHQQLEAMPNDELDGFVATVVMGWKKAIDKPHPEGTNEPYWCKEDGVILRWVDEYDDPFDPATSWSSMGEVIEQMQRLGFACEMVVNQGMSTVAFSQAQKAISQSYRAPFVMPRVVAIAALLAVQELCLTTPSQDTA